MTAPTPAETVPDVPAPPATVPAPAPAPTPAAATPEAPATPAKRSLEDSLASLDAETKAYVLGEVTKARSEAKNLRDRVKEADPAKAKAELLGEISKALGLAEPEPDSATLTQQITTEKATARQAQVELAVYRAAGPLNGDPAALLDSRSFMASLTDVDPTDPTAVQAAIQAAVTANPALGVAPTRRLPGPPPPAGGAPAGLDDQITAAKKAGDTRLWMHLENQKLTAPGR